MKHAAIDHGEATYRFARKVGVFCPACGDQVLPRVVRDAFKYACCGMYAWGGKPIVTKDIHDARRAFRKAFERLWRERRSGTDESCARAKSRRNRMEKAARHRAYVYLSSATGIDEPDCHGSRQVDIDALARLTAAARNAGGPERIRTWWQERQQRDRQ